MEVQEQIGKKTAYGVETIYHSKGAEAARDLLRKEFTELKDPTAVNAMVEKLRKDSSSNHMLQALSLEEVEPKADGTLVAGTDKECMPVFATKAKLNELAQDSAVTGDAAFEKLMAQNILEQYADLMGPASPYNPKFGHDSRSLFGCNPDGVIEPDIDRLRQQYESVRTLTHPIPVRSDETTPQAGPDTAARKPTNQGPELVGAKTGVSNQGPELVGAKTGASNQGPELVGAKTGASNQGPELVGAKTGASNQGPELVGANAGPGNRGPELVGKEPPPSKGTADLLTDKSIDVMTGAGYWDAAAESLGFTPVEAKRSIADVRAYVNSHTGQKDKTRIFQLMKQLQKDNHNKVLHPHEKLVVTAQELEQSEER